MNQTKTCFIAILLASVALWAVCGSALAQNWRQDAWQDEPAAGGAPASADWQQRVLKQSQPPRRVASDRWVSPSQSAGQMPTEQSQMASAAMPMEQPARVKTRAKWVSGREVIPPGTPVPQFDEPMTADEAFSTEGGGGCSECGGDECGGDSCDGPECGQACDFGYEIFDGRCHRWLRDFSFFVGGDAFKGPLDRGKNGNFGLNEGLNLAGPLGDPWGCGYQIGANFVQSNFSGAPTISTPNYTLFAPCRRQTFVTGGIFRRALCHGFQGGVAFDYLHDEYYQSADLTQIRSETGFVINDSYEIGYYGVYGLQTDRVIDGKLDPTDMFVIYMRRYFDTGGEGRLWGGATGSGDGLLGVDLWLPLGKGFALENRINYMIPKQGSGATAQPRESWGFAVQLVWYPGQTAVCMKQNPFRAMFNVADNSLFMVDRLAQ
jgi:hypothetical protein